MKTMTEQPQWLLQASGDFELSDREAGLIPVSNKKARALLMLLADARNGRRSRQVLRSFLWPDVQDDQAANSLRQCLSQLRRVLPDGMIEADLDGVTLNNTSLVVNDPQGRQHRPFFEDAPFVGEEFEDWLRETRAFWQDQAERGPETSAVAVEPETETESESESEPGAAVAESVPVPTAPQVAPPPVLQVAPQPIPTPRPSFAIGVLDSSFSAVATDGPSPFEGLATRTTEGIIQTLTDLLPIDVFDLRGQALGFGVAPQGAPDIAIRTVVEHVADQLSLTFTVTRVPSGQRLWGQTIMAAQDDMLRMDSITLSAFIGETADRLAFKLSEEQFATDPQEQDRLGLQAFHLLNRLFQLNPNEFDEIESTMARAQELQSGRLDTIALSAYASTFLKGEHLNLESNLRNSTQTLLSAAGDLSPDVRALSLTCLAHALAYVVEDHGTAEDLLEQAAKLTPHQAFVWDHFALLRHYQGHSEEAYRLAKRAVTLGAHSPFRFAYATTLSMTATMTGRYDEALTYSRRAINARPNFLAPHRYRFMAQALSGREDEAAKSLASLKQLDPAIIDPEARRGRFALPNESMNAVIEPSFSQLLPKANDLELLTSEEDTK